MKPVRIDRDGRTARLIVDRPPLNILDLAALEQLGERLIELADEESIQLLIVEGAGDKAFSAGVAVEDHTPDRIGRMLETFHAALHTLAAFPAPTLAAIRGHCLGGGMELAACCDLRIASRDATFGQPEIALGCYPPWAAAHYPTLLGLGTTVDLLITGRTCDAEEARRLGFLQRLVDPAQLDRETASLAAKITAQSAAVSRLTIAAIRARSRGDFESALAESERLYTEELTRTADMSEGLEAFLEKRSPDWQHR